MGALNEQFSNNASTTLNGAIATTPAAGTVETWTLASTSMFSQQSGQTRLLVDSEIVIGTTPPASGTTISVKRAMEGTTAATHATGATITHVLTDGVMEDVVSRLLNYGNLDAGWAPTGMVENLSRFSHHSASLAPASQTLYLFGGITLPRGRTITAVTFQGGSQAAVTPTNWWFNIVRVSDRVILASTADQLTGTWVAGVTKTIALTANYTPTDDIPVWIGHMQKATTPANIIGCTTHAGISGLTPVASGTSNTGQTVPLAVGVAVTAPTAIAQVPWCAISVT